MGDGSARKYQSHVADSEEADESESSSSDTSSDSLDLLDSELEISVAAQYADDMELCEVYSNPNVDCNDSIEQCEEFPSPNTQLMQNIEQSGACGGLFHPESHWRHIIEQSKLWPNRDSECNAATIVTPDLPNIDSNRLENVFPLKMIHRGLNKQRTHEIKTVAVDAAVYMAAVIEYMTREVLDLAVSRAQISKRTRIKPSDVSTAIQYDDDMSKLFEELKVGAEDSLINRGSFDIDSICHFSKDT